MPKELVCTYAYISENMQETDLEDRFYTKQNRMSRCKDFSNSGAIVPPYNLGY